MRKEFSYFEKDGQYFPIIEVKLRNSRKEIIVKALVDSGASFSVFRPEIAQELGITLEKGEKNLFDWDWGKNLGVSPRTPFNRRN